ncbi:MAG: hypothetical protein ACI9W2_005246, partial [Gammaproteobacteria bacterium]
VGKVRKRKLPTLLNNPTLSGKRRKPSRLSD